MNKEPITLKEFAAIMTAGAIIMTALISTNHPVATKRVCAPIYLGQFDAQFGSGDRVDLSDGSYHSGSDPFYSEHVAPPGTAYSGFSRTFSTLWGNVASFFGGLGRYLMPTQCY